MLHKYPVFLCPTSGDLLKLAGKANENARHTFLVETDGRRLVGRESGGV
jgi:hypothetical protein